MLTGMFGWVFLIFFLTFFFFPAEKVQSEPDNENTPDV